MVVLVFFFKGEEGIRGGLLELGWGILFRALTMINSKVFLGEGGPSYGLLQCFVLGRFVDLGGRLIFE